MINVQRKKEPTTAIVGSFILLLYLFQLFSHWLNNISFKDVDIDKLVCSDEVLTDAQKFIERDEYGIVIKRRDFKIKKGSL